MRRTLPFTPNIADARNFGRGFDPSRQRDQAQLQDVRLRARGAIPLSIIESEVQARTQAPQLVQAPFLKPILKAATPVLLIPFNARRQSLKVANFQVGTGALLGIVLSFGAPINAAGNYAGWPIPALTGYEETNGSISVDDVYVTCNDATAAFPIWVLGYEGTLSVVANKA